MYFCSGIKSITNDHMEYLDFEQPIKELEEQMQKCALIGDESDVDMTDACKKIEKKLIQTKKEIYSNLTPWQRVQISRHGGDRSRPPHLR